MPTKLENFSLSISLNYDNLSNGIFQRMGKLFLVKLKNLKTFKLEIKGNFKNNS